MAVITRSATGNPRIDSRDQLSLTASVAVSVGQPVNANSSGQWVLAGATTTTLSTAVYIAGRSCGAGEALTAYRITDLDMYDVSALSVNAPIYLSDTAGELDTAAGTQTVLLGRVTPTTGGSVGAALNKFAKIACPL